VLGSFFCANTLTKNGPTKLEAAANNGMFSVAWTGPELKKNGGEQNAKQYQW
jgi:hypothetical protein